MALQSLPPKTLDSTPRGGLLKTLIVGNGARESSIASRLAEDSSVYAVMNHQNPTIVDAVISTQGQFLIADTNNSDIVSNFAKTNSIDLAIVNNDDSLEKGVVDALLERDITTFGPTRAGAQIEWDKVYALRLMREVLPEYTPRFWIASSNNEIETIISELKHRNIQIAVKPQGLTGGKGVKVMGEHLPDYNSAKLYAKNILKERIGHSDKVLFVQKIQGIEFTIMALTDGKSISFPPVSYDYPFRYDGDKGPGTGGMGAFTQKDGLLPFLSEENYKTCQYIIAQIIKKLSEEGKRFNGVLNSGFFSTGQGIMFLEYNARFGDPEAMNIMSLIDGSVTNLFHDIAKGNLNPSRVSFKNKASVSKYLVAPSYPTAGNKSYHFDFDLENITKKGISIYFSAAERSAEGGFNTVGTSRTVGLVCLDDFPSRAATNIDMAINNYFKGSLDYRTDIGAQDYLDRLHL